MHKALTRARHPGLSTAALFPILLSGASAGAAAPHDLTASLSVLVSGSAVTYNATVCSPGKKAGAFAVGLYRDRGQAPACGTQPDHVWPVASLAAGSCLSLTRTESGLPAGTSKAWVFADWDCQIDESSESNNSAAQSYSVTAELQVSQLQVKATGDEVTYTVAVTNTGTDVVVPVLVGLYFDRASPPDCAAKPDAVLSFAGLPAGGQSSKSHSRQAVKHGSYQAWALVDQSCSVLEQDEANNTVAAAYQVGPNLYLMSPIITVTGSTVHFTVDVCNWSSSADASAFTVALWYDLAGLPACGAPGATQVWQVPGLAVGACATLKHTRTAAPAGTFNATVFADPDCLFAESDETDNQRSKSYTVGAALTPDLQASGLTSTVAGEQVAFKASFCNQGQAAAPTFSVGLYLDRSSKPTCAVAPDVVWSVGALAPGACQSLTHTAHSVGPGAHQAWLLVDSSCAVAEKEEANNTMSHDYAVSQPDLTVTSFSASASGSQVSYTALVCNGGPTVPGPFSVGFYFGRPTAPDCASSPDQVLPASGLAAGSCTLFTAKQAGAAPGERKAWVLADSLCQISEASEANNLMSYDHTVGGDSPDLRVTHLSTIVEAEAVSFLLTTCNVGAASSAASEVGLHYHRAAPPGCGDPPSWAGPVPALPPGECATQLHRQIGLPAGEHLAWALADQSCAVGESAEDNNTTSHPYQVTAEAVDLQVTQLSVEISGARLLVLATVCNAGDRLTPLTRSSFWSHRLVAPTCGDSGDASAELPSLAPGECGTQSWVREAGAPGSYTAWILTDPDCRLGEGDALNNLASASYTIAALPADQPGPVAPVEPQAGGCTIARRPAPSPFLLAIAVLFLVIAFRRRWF